MARSISSLATCGPSRWPRSLRNWSVDDFSLRGRRRERQRGCDRLSDGSRSGDRGGAAPGRRCARRQMVAREGSRPVSAEQRLNEPGITLPAPPEPFGAYVEAVETGNLLFLSGMLPTEGLSSVWQFEMQDDWSF